MSPLVSVEHRQEFCDSFLPELRRRVAAGEATDPWIDDTLRRYGKDARALVRGAVEAWLDELRVDDPTLAERIAALF